jgi:hypothetical protein
MNWQSFVGLAFLNSINFGTPRKSDRQIYQAEDEILDIGDPDEEVSPFKAF